jgi:two-component system response regulator NreC
MNRIHVGIFDEHTLVQEGIISILHNYDDIEINLIASGKNQLMEKLKLHQPHVLMFNVHHADVQTLNLIMQVCISYSKVKILVISVHNEEETILRTIKAGAKGFLSKESAKSELLEAIYTLRSGHDYYSQSITQLLLKKYISKIQNEPSDGPSNFNNLSTREVEIIQLWGNSFTNKEIADKLFISVRTVESHKNHIMQKLNLKTSVDLLKFAIKNNLIEI